MHITARGILSPGQVGTHRACVTFPSTTVLSDGSLLASCRVGSTKDSDDETLELRRSHDGGRTWSEPRTPFSSTLNGRHCSIKAGYITPLDDRRLILVALMVDRQAYPGQPLFNENTEGCLPMYVVLSNSDDLGETWSPWRVLPLPDSIGPPSLTSPILKLAGGRLAVSIESNKPYLDTSKWYQHVAYAYSDDDGRTWGDAVTVCQDPTARIFNWDQRAAVAPGGEIVTFTWTYDREAQKYLNVHRRLSRDEGQTWSPPEDLGFADQPSRPAILSDGRVVVAWVDRFGSRSIKARVAESLDAPFPVETEVTLYQLEAPAKAAGEQSTGELLAEMGIWSFGLPFATALPDGDVLVTYYAGTKEELSSHWARLSLD
ncbi:MAG: exo-alpha-sialidase [Planctomycetaceae bacterium]|nr:exo-alpha-sialidase [Planctomycetaceae bacterium]